MQSSYPSQPNSTGSERSKPTVTTQSIADLVLDAESYSALVKACSKPAEVPDEQITPLTTASESHHVPHPTNHHAPPTSIADLVLNNVTYDAILNASKNVEPSSQSQHLPSPATSFAGDAPAPLNCPTSGPTGAGLSEDSVSYYNDELKRWVNKKAGSA